jgi:anthranilate phosphoribosyltransferase
MGERTWPHLIATLLRGANLSTTDTAWAMGEIMDGSATPAQVAGFVVALRAKGETPSEIAGLVAAMLANATSVALPEEIRTRAIDVVGTGGDGAHTVNISTMAALLAAAAGVPVVKHGNRAASSSCGTADVLESLGLPLDLGPEAVARCVEEVGIGFCFAARFHPGMRHAAVPRRELGVPTAFNILGPLTNPARPTAGVVGCADPRMAGVMASVFAERGDRVLVVRGEDGLDEVTTAAATRVWAACGGTVSEFLIDTGELGIARSGPGDLRGGDATFNAEVVRRVFAGQPGPVRDAVLVNAALALAAAALSTAEPVSTGTLIPAMRSGLERATSAVDSGAAADLLARWIAFAATLRAAAN